MRRGRTCYFVSLLTSITACAVLVGMFTWAQKAEETTESRGTTLADLGVTTEQTERIKALWEIKRQKHIKAVENLRLLNRLAKDLVVTDDEIGETLKTLRQSLLEREKKIKSTEEKLIEELPYRAQLHLTILGVLENGLTPRRIGTASPKDKKRDSVKK